MILPADFESRMRIQLGSDFPLFADSLTQVPPVSIRINPYKIQNNPKLEKVPWTDYGFYLPERPVFSSDPLWHCGAYYVQEASSMAIEQPFKHARQVLNGPMKVLDLCAAPGGKSTHLASLLDQNDVLVANEVIRSRIPALVENLAKQGYPNILITHSDSEDFAQLGPVFDLILVDAPCSGEGLFRKDPDSMKEWSPENVHTCELRQRRILDNATQCLKSGGFLIYSTCTYNPGENQAQVGHLLQSGFESVTFDFDNHQAQSEMQFMPHLNKGEGFYMSLLRKNDDSTETSSKKNRNPLKPLKPDAHWLNLTRYDGVFIENRKDLFQVSDHLLEFYNQELFTLNLVKLGICIGNVGDKLFTYSEFLPFSNALNLDSFQTLNLDHATALDYLAKNALPCAERDKKGHVILRYLNQPIGFGKYAGNRINNLFPNDWRLRKIPPREHWLKLPF